MRGFRSTLHDLEGLRERTGNKFMKLNASFRLMETTKPNEEIPVLTRPCVSRRTIDYTGPLVKLLYNRFHVRSVRDLYGIQPTLAGALEILPPCAYPNLPASSFNTKFVHVSQNKVRCAINVVLWTPEGRRCMTGTASGEFTLWSGSTFSFESILQAHEFGIRAMRFSHNEHYLVSGDDSGRIKYWKPNLELLNDAVAHREAVRGICFSPSDLKFCTCSDDATLKLWDFRTCDANNVLSGHGADVKCIDWHPIKGLIASGSKDAQIKLWTPKDAKCVSTLYGHKSGIHQVWWNRNGNWLLSCSRDQVVKVFDIRMVKELGTFRGHNREVTCCQWHPNHEEMFVSGGSDGSLIYWMMHHKTPQAKLTNAHDTTIWSISWHPIGHLLASGSSDYVTKFWCRPRPGDMWRDRHFQEFGDSKETHSHSNVASGINEPISIPGIDDLEMPVRKPSIQRYVPRPFLSTGAARPIGVFPDDAYKTRRQRFDLNLTTEEAPHEANVPGMESEMATTSEIDEIVMGSSLSQKDARSTAIGGLPGMSSTRPRFSSSIRIPKQPSADRNFLPNDEL